MKWDQLKFFQSIFCKLNLKVFNLSDLEKVKQNSFSIQHIKNPSKKVQLAAVEQNGYSIKYIKNPSLKVQLAAVRQDITTLEYTTQEFKELYPEYFL